MATTACTCTVLEGFLVGEECAHCTARTEAEMAELRAETAWFERSYQR